MRRTETDPACDLAGGTETAQAQPIRAKFAKADARTEKRGRAGIHAAYTPGTGRAVNAFTARKRGRLLAQRPLELQSLPVSARHAENAERDEGRDQLTLTTLTSNTTAWPGPTGERGLSP